MAEDASDNAAALFEQGRSDLARGDYESACAKLRQSDQLDPAPGTKLNLGECEALRGHVATAWELFRRVESQLPADDIRLPVAKKKREAVEARVPRVVVGFANGVPPEARVHIGRRIVERAELGAAIAIDPGPVEVVVTAPGYAEQRVLVTLQEGKTERVALAPERLPGTPPPMVAPLPAASAPMRVTTAHVIPRAVPTNPTRRAGYAFLGVGIGGAVIASIAGVVTLDAKRVNQENCPAASQTCNQTGRDAASRGRLFGAITTAGLVLGGAGIGLGTYLIVKGSASQNRIGSVSLQSDGIGSRLVFEREFW